MGFKIFLDTNIILDIFHQDRPFHHDTMELFNNLDENKFNACYSESVLTTMAYVLRKSLTVMQINEAIAILNKKILLLPCLPALINKCLIHHAPDIEDALLYEIALHHQMDYFITPDIKDFKRIQNSELPVMNAKGFNELFR